MLPALIWMLTQFAMSGAMASSATNTMQVTLCTPGGAQQIVIDLETGEPVQQISMNNCEWCQSFNLAVNVPSATDALPQYITWVSQICPIFETTSRAFLWQVAGFKSRAPPV